MMLGLIRSRPIGHFGRTDQDPALQWRLSLRDRLSWARIEHRRTPSALAGHLVAIGLLTGVFRTIESDGPWGVWLATSLLVWLARLGFWSRLCPREESDLRSWLRWDGFNTWALLLQGMVTGLACAAFRPQASGLEQSTLLIVVFSCVTAAVPALSNRGRLLSAYALLTAGPMVLALILDDAQAAHLELVGTSVLLSGLVLWIASNHQATINHIARLKRQEEELRLQMAEQARASEAARLEAQAADEAKSQLLAAASHDLRQPLLALQLYGLHFRRRLCEPQDQAPLDGLSRSLQSLDTMITDLLDLGRREAGALRARMEAVSLSEVFARVQPQVGPAAFDRGLRLRWRGGHHRIWADAQMLERCLRNLILNAIEHTADGGVLVGIRLRQGHLCLQVWDSGSGVPTDQLNALFDSTCPPPTPGSSHRSSVAPCGAKRLGGCGLGLTIVRRLAHLMGAQIRADSRLGQGSVFELRWPLGPAQDPHSPKAQADGNRGSSDSSTVACSVLIHTRPS